MHPKMDPSFSIPAAANYAQLADASSDVKQLANFSGFQQAR